MILVSNVMVNLTFLSSVPSVLIDPGFISHRKLFYAFSFLIASSLGSFPDPDVICGFGCSISRLFSPCTSVSPFPCLYHSMRIRELQDGILYKFYKFDLCDAEKCGEFGEIQLTRQGRIWYTKYVRRLVELSIFFDIVTPPPE